MVYRITSQRLKIITARKDQALSDLNELKLQDKDDYGDKTREYWKDRRSNTQYAVDS